MIVFGLGTVLEADDAMLRIDVHHLVAEPDVADRPEWLEVGDEATVARIAEPTIVVEVIRVCLQRAAEHFLELWTVQPGPDPVGVQIGGVRRVVFDRVLHRKCLGERVAETHAQPILVVADRWLFRTLRDLDELKQDLRHQVGRQPMQVDLRGMLDPVPLPIVVDLGRKLLEAPLDVSRKKILDARIIGEGHVRTFVKSPPPGK